MYPRSRRPAKPTATLSPSESKAKTNRKTAGFGTRSYTPRARPVKRPWVSARSPERATHSSAPICGPDRSGWGSVGGTSLISDLRWRRDSEDPGRSQEQEPDQDREHDHVLVRGGDVADGKRAAEPDR